MIITGPRAAGGPPVTPLDRKALDDYLAELSRTPISRYNRTEQLAYWINLYNALTVSTVVKSYPVASDINRGNRRSQQGPGMRH